MCHIVILTIYIIKYAIILFLTSDENNTLISVTHNYNFLFMIKIIIFETHNTPYVISLPFEI